MMWIVRIALSRPYTFAVVAIAIVLMGILTIREMPTDIFPEINIPVVSVIWSYNGVTPDDMEKRIVTVCERSFTTTVNDIEHMESQSYNGVSVIKVFFHPDAKIESAVAQISATTETILRVLPPGTTAPLILRFNASSVPILQLSLSSQSLSEEDLYDYGLNFIRTQLATVQGAAVPLPYGGKSRLISVDTDPKALFAYHLSPADVVTALNAQNLILPTGIVRIGQREYTVALNSSPQAIDALNDLPVKQVGKTTVYMRDVAQIHEGSATQTNVVRVNGKRGALLTVLKSGNISTLNIIDDVKKTLPRIMSTLPKSLDITSLFDQSIFVRAAIEGVLREGIIAASLTALMILVFIGSWRSTLIVVVSIPLAILCSIVGLYIMGNTLNIMTLGGLALAVGILVDDATVEVENIHRNMGEGKRIVRAILDGAQQIATPTFVSTMSICIVFAPVFFITGVGKWLFTPLALAVVLAMVASYLLSRTVVPLMARYLINEEPESGAASHAGSVVSSAPPRTSGDTETSGNAETFGNAGTSEFATSNAGSAFAVKSAQDRSEFDAVTGLNSDSRFNASADPVPGAKALDTAAARDSSGNKKGWSFDAICRRLHEAVDGPFNNTRNAYISVLELALAKKKFAIASFAIFCVSSLCLLPLVGQDFFPSVDAGQFRLHVRVPSGTRIEETEIVFGQVERAIRAVLPADSVHVILDNIGLPLSGINLAFSDSATVGGSDGEILVALKEPGHTGEYLKKVRAILKDKFPELVCFTQPADIVSQILNFGLSAPIDIQVTGRDEKGDLAVANWIQSQLAAVSGSVDVHLRQIVDAPQLRVNIDRTKAEQAGLTQQDVADNVLISLSSSGQAAPNYWLNYKNGVNYQVAAQTPFYKINTMQKLLNTPIVGSPANAAALGGSNGFAASSTAPAASVGATPPQAQLLRNLGTISRETSKLDISHYDIQPVFDVLANVQDRDLGSLASAVDNIVKEANKKLPRGSFIKVRGQVDTMRSSFASLETGIILSIALVYLLLVVNFQSWVDPLIILSVLPGTFSGILWMLFGCQTTFSIPAMMGMMMSIGVATANSILVISFANEKRETGVSAEDAAMQAGKARFRPVIMTALAMVVGMMPMALGLGEGGEQNAPLGRAVIGGLSVATICTLIFVPVIYSIFRKKERPHIDRLSDEDTPQNIQDSPNNKPQRDSFQ